MSNVILGFPTWTDTVTWSGGNWQAARPITNVINPEMGRVARSTDVTEASTQCSGALSTPELVDLVTLVLPNATTDAIGRIKLKDGSGNELADSGEFEIFPEVYPADGLLWEDERFWYGKYRASELSGVLWTRPYKFDAPKLTSTVEVFISDTANGAGYLDVPYIDVAQSWQLALNPAPGAQFGFRGSRTKVVQSRGGAKSFDRLPKPNTWQGSVEFMDRDEAMTNRYELDRQLDIDKPFLWWPYPDEPKHWPRTVFIARNRGISPLRHASNIRSYTEIPLDVEQVL